MAANIDHPVERLLGQLTKAHTINNLHKRVAEILFDEGIVTNRKYVKVRYGDKKSFYYFVGFYVEAENNVFEEKIEVMFRPSTQAQRRVLDVYVQIGTETFKLSEDADRNKSDRKTFLKEERKALADLRAFFRKEMAKRQRRRNAA